MKTIGVRELKSQLSQYLRLVKSGETILVSEHNRVIAEIGQPRVSTENPWGKVERMLAEGEKTGQIIRAKRSASVVQAVPTDAMIDWQAELDDLRAERL